MGRTDCIWGAASAHRGHVYPHIEILMENDRRQRHYSDHRVRKSTACLLPTRSTRAARYLILRQHPIQHRRQAHTGFLQLLPDHGKAYFVAIRSGVGSPEVDVLHGATFTAAPVIGELPGEDLVDHRVHVPARRIRQLRVVHLVPITRNPIGPCERCDQTHRHNQCNECLACIHHFVLAIETIRTYAKHGRHGQSGKRGCAPRINDNDGRDHHVKAAGAGSSVS